MQENVPSSIRTILIIEDDPLTSWALMRALKADARNILAVEKGVQALSEIRTTYYDIIFLEISPLDQSGMAVLEEVSRSEPSTCVVVMSADILDEKTGQNIIDHNHFFLPKPFDVLQVRTLVSRILAEKMEAGPGRDRSERGNGERRQWPRSKHSSPVVCIPFPAAEGPGVEANFNAEVEDVSRGGLGLRTYHPLPPGQRIHFKGETAVWDGIVRWSLVSGNQFRAGVAFE